MRAEHTIEPREDLRLTACPYCARAFEYWRMTKKEHGHTFFFSWLNHTQGVTRINGLDNLKKPRKTDWIEFVDEQSKLMFILRWG